MKKIVLLISVLVLALALVGCDDIFEKDGGNDNIILPSNSQHSKEGSVISKQNAINIAIKHANLKVGDVSYVLAELDYDDGIEKYEIEFRYGGYEYEYEINAQSGEIISHSKEIE